MSSELEHLSPDCHAKDATELQEKGKSVKAEILLAAGVSWASSKQGRRKILHKWGVAGAMKEFAGEHTELPAQASISLVGKEGCNRAPGEEQEHEGGGCESRGGSQGG